jgi:hypothetical protein
VRSMVSNVARGLSQPVVLSRNESQRHMKK